MSGIEVSKTFVSTAINDQEVRVPVIHAFPMRYDDPTNSERLIYFCSGFGNTVQASVAIARLIASETQRPVVIAPPQTAHTTLRDPRTQVVETFKRVNEVANGFLEREYGNENNATLMSLSHGSGLAAAFIAECDVRDWDILAPMGGNLADIRTQEELDELAGIDVFKDRWRTSMELGSAMDSWRLLGKFGVVSALETWDMIRAEEYKELNRSAYGVAREVLNNLRLVRTPERSSHTNSPLAGLMNGKAPDELRLRSVLLEAFYAGATLDFRGEVAKVIKAGKLAVVACGARDRLFPLDTVKRTLQSHPDMKNGHDNLIFAEEVPDVIHPNPVRVNSVMDLVSAALKARSQANLSSFN